MGNGNCVPYYSTVHPNNRIQEQVTGKILPGFHCMHMNKILSLNKHLVWEKAKEKSKKHFLSLRYGDP